MFMHLCNATEGVGGINIDIDVIKKYGDQMTRSNRRNFDGIKNCAFGYWKITFKSLLVPFIMNDIFASIQ